MTKFDIRTKIYTEYDSHNGKGPLNETVVDHVVNVAAAILGANGEAAFSFGDDLSLGLYCSIDSNLVYFDFRPSGSLRFFSKFKNWMGDEPLVTTFVSVFAAKLTEGYSHE